MLERTSLLNKKIKNLPSSFGVYLFIDINKNVIYIGKSVNIKTRVLSYFKSKIEKCKIIISQSFDIDHFLVESEYDALILENNLIKKHNPKYNFLLKDDKSFSWLCIKKERFPRVFISRQKKRNEENYYFGPYVSKKLLLNIFRTIKEFFPIRSCNYNLSASNIENKKYRVCFDFYLKNCLGPCQGFQSEEEYQNNINSIFRILEGRYSDVLTELNKKIYTHVKDLEFERANEIKNKIKSIKSIKSETLFFSKKIINLDCFYILLNKNYFYINFIRVIEGAIIYIKTNKIINNNNDIFSVLEGFINQTYLRYGKINKTIISNISNNSHSFYKIVNPKIGYKKKLLDFSYKKIIESFNSYNKVLISLKNNLSLKNIPIYIEAFDNSTISGKNNTSSCVVFKNGKPCKKEYRHYNINSFTGLNDYLSMEEVLTRRYKKLQDSKKKFPDLIIIDGGIGQKNIATKVLEKLNIKNIDVISIAKKEEIIFYKKFKFKLNKRSNELKLVQYIRNEAHRFCLNHHRKKRKQLFFKTELDNIIGIGPITKNKLLVKFGSMKNIKKATKQEIITLIGLKKYQSIINSFQQNKI